MRAQSSVEAIGDTPPIEPTESAVLSREEFGSHNVEGMAVGFEPSQLEDELYGDVVTGPEAEHRRMARQVAATKDPSPERARD